MEEITTPEHCLGPQQCKFPSEPDGRDQARCVLCNRWHHCECVNEDDNSMVWTCPKCRQISPLMLSMQTDMKHMKKSQNQLMQLLISIKEDLKAERQLRENTEEELWRLRGQYKELVEELHLMTKKMTNSNPAHKVTMTTSSNSKPATPPTKTPSRNSPPEPTKSLLIGTSLLRNINQEMLENWEVIAKGGAKIEDLIKCLAEMPSEKTFKDLVLVAGSIDLEEGSVADVLNSYRAFTVLGSDKAKKIKISSILPRTDKDLKEKAKSLNAKLKEMCEQDGFEFVENDLTFHLLNGEVNRALLQDGLHLTQAGVETLIKNCQIKTKGSPYSNKRYKKPTTKTLFKGPTHPLSNFYPVQGLKVFGRYFLTSEAAYQYKKAMMVGNENMAWKIAGTNKGIKAMQLGSKVNSSDEWHSNKTKVMENVIQAKLRVCKDARDTLINSGNTEIVEDTDHPFWARGSDNNGQNMMGKILMMFRTKMKQNPQMFEKTNHFQTKNRRWASQDYQPRCYRCGEEGHTQDQCRHLQDVYCWTCGDPGHKAKSCDAYSHHARRY